MAFASHSVNSEAVKDGSKNMTLDVQVLVVAFLALSLGLFVEWTGRKVPDTDDRLQPSDAKERGWRGHV